MASAFIAKNAIRKPRAPKPAGTDVTPGGFVYRPPDFVLSAQRGEVPAHVMRTMQKAAVKSQDGKPKGITLGDVCNMVLSGGNPVIEKVSKNVLFKQPQAKELFKDLGAYYKNLINNPPPQPVKQTKKQPRQI